MNLKFKNILLVILAILFERGLAIFFPNQVAAPQLLFVIPVVLALDYPRTSSLFSVVILGLLTDLTQGVVLGSSSAAFTLIFMLTALVVRPIIQPSGFWLFLLFFVSSLIVQCTQSVLTLGMQSFTQAITVESMKYLCFASLVTTIFALPLAQLWRGNKQARLGAALGMTRYA